MSNFSISIPTIEVGTFPTTPLSFATSTAADSTMSSFGFSSNPFASPTSFVPTSFNPSSLPSSTPTSFVASSQPISSAPFSSEPVTSSFPASSSVSSSSSALPPSSSIQASSIIGTTTVVAPTSAVNTVTQVLTSVRTFAPPTSNSPPATSVVLITRTSGVAPTVANTQPAATRSAAPTSSRPAAAGLQANGSDNGSGGLGTPGTVAVAVVVPIVAVALLVVAGIFFWRKRKQNKNAREERRKEVEEYGYNPNDDPTLPAVGGAASDSPEMSEGNGYRGWGSNTNGTMSARKPSTNLSSNGIGMAVSDAQGRGHSPGSPGTHPSEGARSNDPLMDGANGAGIGAGAVAGAGGAYAANRAIHGAGGIQRGPSNASSTYSTGQTDDGGEAMGGAQDLTYDSNYSQYTPYNPNSGGFGDNTSQPIIKDVSARRNTKIENAVYPQPGNSGIAQNF